MNKKVHYIGLDVHKETIAVSINNLGDCFRRWKARPGTPKAITAMAHKLARIIWHLIKHRTPYDPTVWNKAEEKLRKKKNKRLHQTAAALGFKLLTAS